MNSRCHLPWVVGLLVGVAWATVAAAAAEMTLVATGSVWRYLDTGVDAGSAWRSNTFDAGTWRSGTAPLGFGETGLGTELGLLDEPKPMTTYFRREFLLPDPTGINALTVRLACDDGAVVYLNGVEIDRRNLAAGAVGTLTPANVAVEGAEERRFFGYPVYPVLARPGVNVLAVELHQHPASSEDAYFDLELVANLPLTPPEMRLIAPAKGAIGPVAPVRFQVETSDRDGFVYAVRYWLDGLLEATETAEPFEYVWTPTGAGRHRLVAEAVDNSGRRRESEPTHFQVGFVSGSRVVRGPYLQSGSSTGLVVRWRTDWPATGRVRYGLNPQDLDDEVIGQPGRLDHEITLAGLLPDTTYYYSVGTDDGPSEGGTGTDFHFTTAPQATRPVRFWAIGDSGTANAAAAAVRNSYLDMGGQTDLWLMLGDNAYEEGKDGQYQTAVFDMYPALLRSVVLWPTLGNHDAATASPGIDPPYLDIFTLPRNGEAGGLASGTELYYSFDYANIHFVCLDAQMSDRSPGGPMLTWLEEDLAATAKDWIVAFWHHPPYTMGTHRSDSELQLIEMREYALPILERYGVDLVLCGHSHVYERSYLLNGHYGLSSTLQPGMVIDGGDGAPFEGGAYRKPSGGLGANQGTVYVVCGCSGEGGFFPFPRHPAMVRNLSGFGSVVTDVDGLRMSVHFLTHEGGIGDWFVIDKRPPGPVVAPRLDIRAAPSGVELSWPTAETSYRPESRRSIARDEAALDPWTTVPGAPRRVGRQWHLPLTATGSNAVFRLRSVP